MPTPETNAGRVSSTPRERLRCGLSTSLFPLREGAEIWFPLRRLIILVCVFLVAHGTRRSGIVSTTPSTRTTGSQVNHGSARCQARTAPPGRLGGAAWNTNRRARPMRRTNGCFAKAIRSSGPAGTGLGRPATAFGSLCRPSRIPDGSPLVEKINVDPREHADQPKFPDTVFFPVAGRWQKGISKKRRPERVSLRPSFSGC